MLKLRGERLADGRWLSAAAERNKQPILEVLRAILPRRGVVLEIASGTGQHVVYFARALGLLTWQPSDPDAELRQSIAVRCAAEALPNVLPPLELDVCRTPWPVSGADAILCLNMIHVVPWAATEALVAGASLGLPAGGVLYLYGPYREAGRHIAPSNASFDAALRAQDPAWGVRDHEAVVALAGEHALELEQCIAMPANNLSLVFRRKATPRR